MISRRHALFGLALAATLAATWWASQVEEEPAETPAEHPEAARPRRAAAPAAPAPTLAGLDAPRAMPADSPELFQPRSLQPPPPSPPPPPPPQAPALPFRFVGALEEGGERAVFLLEGTQVLMVRAGDQLGGQYRVERITPTSVEFTYLPLKQRQTLATTRP